MLVGARSTAGRSVVGHAPNRQWGAVFVIYPCRSFSSLGRQEPGRGEAGVSGVLRAYRGKCDTHAGSLHGGISLARARQCQSVSGSAMGNAGCDWSFMARLVSMRAASSAARFSA